MKQSISFVLHGWPDPAGPRWFHIGTDYGRRQVSVRPDHLDNDIRCFYDPWVIRILTGVKG